MPTCCAIRGCYSRNTPGFYIQQTLTPRAFTSAECTAAGLTQGKRGVLCATHTLKTCDVCGIVHRTWLPTTRAGGNPLVRDINNILMCESCAPAAAPVQAVPAVKWSFTSNTRFVLDANHFRIREFVNVQEQSDICNADASFRNKGQTFWETFTPAKDRHFYILISKQKDKFVFCFQKRDNTFHIGPCSCALQFFNMGSTAVKIMLQFCILKLTDTLRVPGATTLNLISVYRTVRICVHVFDLNYMFSTNMRYINYVCVQAFSMSSDKRWWAERDDKQMFVSLPLSLTLSLSLSLSLSRVLCV